MLSSDEPIRISQNKAYEGRRVSFTGYLVVPNHDIGSAHGREFQSFYLSSTPCGEGNTKRLAQFSAKLGGLGKNVVEIPHNFGEANVVVHTADGQCRKCDQKITVSGTVKYLNDVQPVELSKLNPDTGEQEVCQSYSFSLEDVRLDAAQ